VLSLFRTNSLAGVLLLLLLAFLTHLSGFFLEIGKASSAGGVWSDWLYEWVDPASGLGRGIAAFLVFVQALLVNAMISEHRLTGEVRNYIPGAVYIVINSLFPDFLVLSPPLLANTFLLIALASILRTYKKYECAKDLFNTGFFVGAAAMCYNTYLLFFLAVWAGWLVVRGSKIREILMIITGLLTPIFLTGAYLFVTDQMKADTDLWHRLTTNLSFLSFPGQLVVVPLAKVILWSLLILIVLFSINQYMFKKKIQAQKSISITYWFLLLAGITTLVQANIQLDHLLIASVPLSVLLGLTFDNSRSAIGEIFFLILVVCLFCFHMLGDNGLVI
jgi:hypothetical protein